MSVNVYCTDLNLDTDLGQHEMKVDGICLSKIIL